MKKVDEMNKLNEQQQKEINATLDFVTKAHKGQYRKGNGIPFIFHPISVFNTICRWGIVDDIVYKAALAHDVLEDCDCSENDLKNVIGQEALQIVKELTFIPDKNSAVSASDQKAEYMSKIGEKSVQALVIKISDRFNNTRDFLLDKDGTYAVKYWGKASPLFKAFHKREEEITSSFSENSFYKIVSEFNAISREIDNWAAINRELDNWNID